MRPTIDFLVAIAFQLYNGQELFSPDRLARSTRGREENLYTEGTGSLSPGLSPGLIFSPSLSPPQQRKEIYDCLRRMPGRLFIKKVGGFSWRKYELPT